MTVIVVVSVYTVSVQMHNLCGRSTVPFAGLDPVDFVVIWLVKSGCFRWYHVVYAGIVTSP